MYDIKYSFRITCKLVASKEDIYKKFDQIHKNNHSYSKRENKKGSMLLHTIVVIITIVLLVAEYFDDIQFSS